MTGRSKYMRQGSGKKRTFMSTFKKLLLDKAVPSINKQKRVKISNVLRGPKISQKY